VIEPAAPQAGQDHLERLLVDLGRLEEVDAVVRELVRRDATSDAELEPPAAQSVSKNPR